MSEQASITVAMNAESAEFVTGINKGQKSLREIGEEAKKASSVFSDLKSSFGKSSTLGQSLKIIAGKGAISGLTMAMDEVKHFADEIARLKDDMQNGAVSGVEMTNRIMESIPVLGKAWQLGHSLHDAFSSTAAEAKRLKQELQDVAAAGQASLAAWAKVRGEIKSSTEEMAKIKEKVAADSLSPEARPEARVKNRLADELRAVEEARKARIEAVTRADAPEIHRLSANQSNIVHDPNATPAQLDEAEAYNRQIADMQNTQNARIAKINQEAAAERAAREASAAQDLAAAATARGEKEVNIERETARKIADIRAEIQQDGLRAKGKTVAADLGKIQQDFKNAAGDLFQKMFTQASDSGDFMAAAKRAAAEFSAMQDKAAADKRNTVGTALAKSFMGGLASFNLNDALGGGPGKWAEAAQRKLFGVKLADFDEHGPPQPLPSAVERRFDFTVPGTFDGDSIAKRQLAKQEQQAATLAEIRTGISKLADKAVIVVRGI